MMHAVGIDLGTTNSAVAVMKGRPSIVEDEQGNRTVPSAVGWDNGSFIVGIDPKEDPVQYGTIRSIKRLMGTQERVKIGPNSMLPEEVSAEILKVLKKQVEDKTGVPVTDAVITVPAYFQLASKAATKRAGELAGLNVLQLLEEPSAAVMAYGPRDDERILVYDLGGGTFDVSLIDCFAGTLTTKAVFGNNNLGGDDFDRRLMRHLAEILKKEQGISIDIDNPRDESEKVAVSVLKLHAERAKIELSRKSSARVIMSKVVTQNGRPVGLETEIKVADFNAMILDLVQGTLVEVEKALKSAKIDKSKVDTVLLVGGSTYVPLVQKTLKDYFGKDPSKKVNPDLAVALGAATVLIDSGAETKGRHVLTVREIPERFPDDLFVMEGRTTPRSKVSVSGGRQDVNAEADEDGYYTIEVPLKAGTNSFVVRSSSPTGQTSEIEPEPLIHDPSAPEHVPMAPAPLPRLTRALSLSHILTLGPSKEILDAASVIIDAHRDLPSVGVSEDFATKVDNQPELVALVLEGDLMISGLNSRLAEVRLQLPPNVPANQRVKVTYTIDENSLLTAELECMGRKGVAIVSLKSTGDPVHIFQRVENLYTKFGDRIDPRDRATVEQTRLTMEDLNGQLRRLKQGSDVDAIWNTFNRMRASSDQLLAKLDSVEKSLR
jgi:molecular chaperone DnaK (HSP70)